MKIRNLKIRNCWNTGLLAAFIFMICSGNKKATDHVDFSGTWVINLQKSVFDGAPHFTANRQINVKQISGKIIIERFYFQAEGIDSTVVDKDTLLFNSAAYYTLTVDKRQKTATFSWSGDGQQFIISSKFSNVNSENEEYRNKETWSVSDDKKTLTINKTVQDVDGSGYSIIVVYDRAQ